MVIIVLLVACVVAENDKHNSRKTTESSAGSSAKATSVKDESAQTTRKSGSIKTTGKPGLTTEKTESKKTTGKPGTTTGKPVSTTGKPGDKTSGKPGAQTTGKPEAQTTGKSGDKTTGKSETHTTGKPGIQTTVKPESFNDWAKRHGKKYASKEKAAIAEKAYKENAARVAKVNADPNSNFKLKLDRYSDLTIEEFVKSRTGYLELPKDVKKNVTSTRNERIDYAEAHDKSVKTGSKNAKSNFPTFLDYTP